MVLRFLGATSATLLQQAVTITYQPATITPRDMPRTTRALTSLLNEFNANRAASPATTGLSPTTSPPADQYFNRNAAHMREVRGWSWPSHGTTVSAKRGWGGFCETGAAVRHRCDADQQSCELYELWEHINRVTSGMPTTRSSVHSSLLESAHSIPKLMVRTRCS